jgi:hypothetical protein
MGSSGWSIELEPLEGSTPGTWDAVRDVTMQLLWDAWRVALPKPMFKQAWAWVSMGEDSLLTLGDRDQPEDEPTSDITFWFYLSVGWPSELADHWLSLALAEKRAELESNLGELGYRIKPGSRYPELGKHRYRFIVSGKRIGHASEEGVYWALPEHDYQESSVLSPALRKRLAALVESGACECPYCTKLGLVAVAAKKKPAAKKK